MKILKAHEEKLHLDMEKVFNKINNQILLAEKKKDVGVMIALSDIGADLCGALADFYEVVEEKL